jgi:hypothetical protein
MAIDRCVLCSTLFRSSDNLQSLFVSAAFHMSLTSVFVLFALLPGPLKLRKHLCSNFITSFLLMSRLD